MSAKTKAPPANYFETLFGLSIPDAQERMESLTPREREVIICLSKGTKAKLIADELGISHKTLDIHRANIMRKFRVKTSTAMMNVFYLGVLVRDGAATAVDDAAAMRKLLKRIEWDAGDSQPGTARTSALAVMPTMTSRTRPTPKDVNSPPLSRRGSE